MPLTDRQIRNASAPSSRVVKLSDGEGLQLWLQPSGAKLWNMAYRFDGKQRKLAIGPYPRISLKDARARRDEAKKLLAEGFDPSQQKRIAKLYEGRNDCPRLPRRRLIDPQRMRPMEPGRNRSVARPCRRQRRPPRLCAS
jgi:hypothetical protein